MRPQLLRMSTLPLPTRQSSSTSTVETNQHTVNESVQLESEASNADLAPLHPTLTNTAVPKPLPVTQPKVKTVRSESTAQTTLSLPQTIIRTRRPQHNETDPDVWASYAQLLMDAIHDCDRVIASHQRNRITVDNELSSVVGMMRLVLSLEKQ
ncbi:hypothetical protein ONZ45_g18388 [Pleurotus djamor]|nr:hypothetical protein ONZ45_g18388 [Pleurotus djamor]